MTPELLAHRLLGSGIICDPYVSGELRFASDPVVLSATRLDEMGTVAEDIAGVYDEVARICLTRSELLDDFLELTPCQKLMWQASCPAWHGFARADVFETEDGLVITELNSDTPTGHAEAVVLGELARAARPDLVDPNAGLEGAIMDLVGALAPSPGPLTVGIVFPTDLTEDLPLVRLYQRWLAARGHQAILGSPFNLTRGPGKEACLFGRPCDVILRHYKTDWWCERFGVWTDDDPFDDPLPLAGPLAILVEAELEGKTRVLNPFGAVVTQNKRAMALMWERIDLFTPPAADTIRKHVPYTVRLEALHAEQVVAERERWVLKSDYGCEGDEVVIGALVPDDLWAACVANARPGRWIAQERFTEVSEGTSTNFGVYLAGGRAAGAYVRRADGPTDKRALSVPLLVSVEGERGP